MTIMMTVIMIIIVTVIVTIVDGDMYNARDLLSPSLLPLNNCPLPL